MKPGAQKKHSTFSSAGKNIPKGLIELTGGEV